MSKFNTFLCGFVMGAVSLYCAMTYHVIRAEDGVHVVRKVSAGLGGAYVDIRGFSAAQWTEHRHVALALINADKEELLQDTAVSHLRETADHALQSLGLR
jgi:hypothetical protein